VFKKQLSQLKGPFLILGCGATLLFSGCGSEGDSGAVAGGTAEPAPPARLDADNSQDSSPSVHEGDDFYRSHQLNGHPDSVGWDELFGKDLSEADFDPEVWKLEAGTLTATRDKMIWTKDSYDEYILDLEFKTASGTNSGVIIHVSDVSKWVPNSLEIQIADDFHEKWASKDRTWQCAAVFGRKAATQSLVKRPGEWNRMTILCEGPYVDVVLNGVQVNSMDMREWTSETKNPDGSTKPKWLNKPLSQHPSEGNIGLQGKHGESPIWFRNIRIQEL
jgi:hypothetical protein